MASLPEIDRNVAPSEGASGYDKFYIGGAWVEPLGGSEIAIINPATEEEIARAAMGSAEDADRAVAAAKAAFDSWSTSSIEERRQLLQDLLEGYKEASAEIEALLVEEIGLITPISKGHSVMSISHIETALGLLESYEFETRPAPSVTLTKEPVGVCTLITSWNAPVSQILCKAVPAIAAGCTVVVKPSENAPLSGIRIAKVFDAIGTPPGVFNLVNGLGTDLGARLASHPDVDMISFTGSVGGGGKVAQEAAPTIKRVHQELGGKSPNILLPDADFEAAVPKSVMACLMNSGQTCAAPSRLIVPEDRFDDVAALAVETAKSIVVGAPDDPKTTIGPLSNRAQFDRVQRFMETAIAEKTPLLLGGPGRPEGLSRGFYARPTIFGPVSSDATIAREEIFGPVLVIQTYRDEDEAVRIANDTRYGLSGYVQSRDADHAARVARRIRAGYVTVNFPGWTAAAPFGGYKQSGNGREWGIHGLEDFMEVKAVMGA
jgi:aldehyde dehydrogenase (NAD+)